MLQQGHERLQRFLEMEQTIVEMGQHMGHHFAMERVVVNIGD